MVNTRNELPSEPLDRLSLLVVDLIDYAEKGGLPEDRSKALYDAVMEGLAGLEVEEQGNLLDRLRAWTEPPKGQAR